MHSQLECVKWEKTPSFCLFGFFLGRTMNSPVDGFIRIKTIGIEKSNPISFFIIWKLKDSLMALESFGCLAICTETDRIHIFAAR